jgi:hypothetical protein
MKKRSESEFVFEINHGQFNLIVMKTAANLEIKKSLLNAFGSSKKRLEVPKIRKATKFLNQRYESE